MDYVHLSNGDIKVSKYALGCWALSGNMTWGNQKFDDSVKAVKKAFSLGINFFDTAEVYGDGGSEEVLGRVIKDFREDIILASKVARDNLKPEDVKNSCEKSLQRLNTDYLDIYYIHWPNPQIPISETLGAIEDLKREGKIRAIGCSNFGKNDLVEVLGFADIIANQLPYNLLWRAIEYEIKPVCLDKNIDIIAYSPLAQGLLTGKYKRPAEVPEGRARTRHFSRERPKARHNEEGFEKETFDTIDKIREISREAGVDMIHLALNWILEQKGVSNVIVGARTPAQIEENVKALKVEISEDIFDKLDQVTTDLKNKLGKNPDFWQTDSRFN